MAKSNGNRLRNLSVPLDPKFLKNQRKSDFLEAIQTQDGYCIPIVSAITVGNIRPIKNSEEYVFALSIHSDGKKKVSFRIMASKKNAHTFITTLSCASGMGYEIIFHEMNGLLVASIPSLNPEKDDALLSLHEQCVHNNSLLFEN